MNRQHQIKTVAVGEASGTRRFRSFGKTMAAACALSLALYGCSSKGNTNKVVVPENPEPKPTTALDSLIKANAGKGKGVVTGFLTGEGKSIAQGLLKQASNAAGERRLLTRSEVPLKKATVLIFNSLKPTTAPDTTITTNDSGNYTAVLPEGKYFGFAVYLDLETFQLVTTSIPNMNPKADVVVKMDTAIAIEDVTAPTVAGVFDANAANDDGIFLVGSVPDKGARINVTFSEPMNRESAKGIVLGRIDTSNASTSMVLSDTLKGATFTWSGDSKELTIHVSEFVKGDQYGLIMPVSIKDLAKNPLEKEYKATFVTVAAAELAAVQFAVGSTFPADGETLKPIQNPGVSMNRPIETFSILKHAKIEPAITGYWEVSGARAVFIHKDPFTVGTKYTVTLPVGVTDLSGAGLEEPFSFDFTVKDFEGAAKDNTGKEKQVALVVESAFDAYLSGDVGRFATAFHPNFRLYNESGEIRSRTQFLDMIRVDVGERLAMSAGFPGPVFDTRDTVCKDRQARWKVGAVGGTAEDQIWVDAYVNPGQSPRAYEASGTEIPAASLTWDRTGPRFTYKGKVYGYGPDMSKFSGPVNMDAAKGDMRFMGDILRQTSTVVLEVVKLKAKEEFKVDAQVTMEGDTLAKLAVKMIEYRDYNRINFGDINMACEGKLVDTSFQVLKFVLAFDGSKWLITSIVEPERIENRNDFDKAVDTRNFEIKEIKPITLVSPLRDNGMVDGKVAFKFNGPALDSIGGYLVGIAEDPKFCFGRPPYGALIFVKAAKKTGSETVVEQSFVLNDKGAPEGSNAASILRRVQDLRLPGWERALFESPLTTLYDASKGFGGVYQWKAIAVKDTSAVQFLANGFSSDRYYAESDFGPTRGYFACKTYPQGAAFTTLETNQQTYVNTQPAPNNGGSYNDMDQDGFPDGIESKYMTDPRNRGSYPDFKVDTDGDGLADFLETILDKDGNLSLVTNKADESGKMEELAKLIAAGIIWLDTDGDGFPNDIEMLSGFNPNDAKSNPGTRPRANAPSGVFAGKFQMGASLYGITFKIYTDSLKNLWVTYTAVIGRDTLADSVRTLFNEGSGEIYIAVALPMNGPDAGKALLLRGRYDAIQSLLMGPLDMIPAVPKTSVNFGGGPYVGQFAASGRGEDVSRFLPGNNGSTTTTNPVTNTNTGVGYRMPPAGVNEGAKLVFDQNKVTLIDDFGDTLAVIENLNLRSQSDGNYEFFGESKVSEGSSFKRSEVGGRLGYDGNGNWIVDGHFFQESDSAGVHKSIPGQFNAKAAKADLTPGATAISGTMRGWIAQDKTGNGFATQPVTTQPCDPSRADCLPVCDPAKGPCDTQPVCDPAKGPCNTDPGTNTFSRPFVAGKATFNTFLERAAVKPGDWFYISMGGRVYRVLNDSTKLLAAKAPWCGQVIMKAEAIPAKSDSAHHLAAFNNDVQSLNLSAISLIILLEDQFQGATPAHTEKARDAQGDIQLNVFIVENRPMPGDYGTSTMQCPVNGPIVNNPPPVCDPTRETCTQLPPCDPKLAVCTQPPPCDTAMGPCNGDNNRPPLYQGSLDVVRTALAGTLNIVGVVKDTVNPPNLIKVNSTTLFFDQAGQFVVVKAEFGNEEFVFLSEPGDPKKLVIEAGVIFVTPKPLNGTVNPPPVDTTKVVGDTTRPVPYKGTIAFLKEILASKGNEVRVMTPNGPQAAKVNPETIVSDGVITTGSDANNAASIFVFLGAKDNQEKPMMSQEGFVGVEPKPTMAAQ